MLDHFLFLSQDYNLIISIFVISVFSTCTSNSARHWLIPSAGLHVPADFETIVSIDISILSRLVPSTCNSFRANLFSRSFIHPELGTIRYHRDVFA